MSPRLLLTLRRFQNGQAVYRLNHPTSLVYGLSPFARNALRGFVDLQQWERGAE